MRFSTVKPSGERAMSCTSGTRSSEETILGVVFIILWRGIDYHAIFSELMHYSAPNTPIPPLIRFRLPYILPRTASSGYLFEKAFQFARLQLLQKFLRLALEFAEIPIRNAIFAGN